MKKSYILSCAILLMSVVANAQTTNTDPTFTITEMGVPAGQEGVIYNETVKTAQIEVKVRNVTAATMDGMFNLPCLEAPNAWFDYSYFKLTSPTGPIVGDHSFIEIHSLGADHIERVEFIMCSDTPNKGADLVCAPSIDGEDYYNSDWELPNEKSVYKGITAREVNDMCTADYSFDVPDIIMNVWGVPVTITDFREKVKYVRLNWGKPFAGSGTSSFDAAAAIFAIKVYTNTDLATSIDEQDGISLTIQAIGRNLQMSELSDVTVYDITGKLVAQYSNIEDTYLDSLNSGVYVVAASGKNGQKTIQKIILE